MKPSMALEGKREAVRALVARYPTANPRLFGSVLHGDRGDSDLRVAALAEISKNSGAEALSKATPI